VSRLLQAALLLAYSLILLSFGSTLFASGAATYLFWGGLLILSAQAFAEWMAEDLGKIPPNSLSGARKRAFRLSSPKFWAFPIMVGVDDGIIPLVVAVVGFALLVAIHLGSAPPRT